LLLENNDILVYNKDFKNYNYKGINCLSFLISILYSCYKTGWNVEEIKKERGNLVDIEKSLLESIDVNASIKILTKYPNIMDFDKSYEHLIEEERVRELRFNSILKKIYKKAHKLTKKIIIEDYIVKNFKKLTKDFKITIEDIENSKLNRQEILLKVSKGELDIKKAEILLIKIEEELKDKLCKFSGNGDNPDMPNRICSMTDDPQERGDCGTCRVASDWEECYG
jgi:hypothetical protein